MILGREHKEAPGAQLLVFQFPHSPRELQDPTTVVSFSSPWHRVPGVLEERGPFTLSPRERAPGAQHQEFLSSFQQPSVEFSIVNIFRRNFNRWRQHVYMGLCSVTHNSTVMENWALLALWWCRQYVRLSPQHNQVCSAGTLIVRFSTRCQELWLWMWHEGLWWAADENWRPVFDMFGSNFGECGMDK